MRSISASSIAIGLGGVIILAVLFTWLMPSTPVIASVSSSVDPPDVVPGRPILIRGHVEDCAWLKIEIYDARTILVSCQPYKVIATWTPTPEPSPTTSSPLASPTFHSSPLGTPLVSTIPIPTGRHDK